MKLIIDIPKEDYNKICETKLPKYGAMIWIIHRAFNYIKNGTPIPDNATNGDVLKAMFPNIEVEEQSKDLFIVFNMDFQGTPFYKAWWNAPYQKGGKE